AGEIFKVFADEVVLSAGAIGSPHLLMLSGIGPREQLETYGIAVVRDVPGVGQNMRDHPAVHVWWECQDEYPIPPEGVGAQKVALRYKAEGSDLDRDMIVVMRFNNETRMLIMSVGIYLEKSAGSLTLASSDPDVQPVLDYNYLSDPFDLERLRSGVHQCVRLSEYPDFGKIIKNLNQPSRQELDSDDDLDAWIRRTVSTMHHISATCKMGPAADPMAVVDQRGKVHGIEGLRVADASIMPDCVRANTNVTTIMIGERVADFIKQGQ
ncbi:MAG: GMC oxidoreductase, partial [Chloroflexi bacterium]|nr:GMC oxidoreductase [Chloroflexota bacterium]